MMTRFSKVDSISNGALKRVLRDLSDDDAPLAVINLSNFEYSGKVKIITEKKLPKWMRAVKTSSTKGFTDKKLYNRYELTSEEISFIENNIKEM